VDQSNTQVNSDLVTALSRGSEEALKQLFDLLGPRVFNYCRKLVHRQEDAEELLQDIFLKIWQFREKIDPGKNFEVLLFTIARNHIINFARKRVSYSLTGTGDLKAYDRPVENEDYRFDLEAVYQQYNKVMMQLSARSREVFVLSREQGLSNKEIAGKLGISVRTVESHISSAIRLLRRELKDAYILLVLFLFQ
jgi:RNA polymerase sigma-70 factor, ECF subfamily